MSNEKVTRSDLWKKKEFLQRQWDKGLWVSWIAGTYPHPSWQLHLETIIISQCGLFDANSSGQFYPLNSLSTMFPEVMEKPQGSWQCHALRAAGSEVLGLTARAKVLMPQFYQKWAKLLPAKDRPACTKQLITDHCGQRQRLLPNVLDYVKLQAFV